MDASIDTGELDKLAAELAAAVPKVDKLSSEKLSEIARKVHTTARSMAPVLTGDLRDSIKMTGSKDVRRVFSDLRYAGFVEFGTSDTAPQPFIWPAARRSESELFEEFSKLGDPFA